MNVKEYLESIVERKKYIYNDPVNKMLCLMLLGCAVGAALAGFSTVSIWCLLLAIWNDVTDHLEHIQEKLNKPKE